MAVGALAVLGHVEGVLVVLLEAQAGDAVLGHVRLLEELPPDGARINPGEGVGREGREVDDIALGAHSLFPADGGQNGPAIHKEGFRADLMLVVAHHMVGVHVYGVQHLVVLEGAVGLDEVLGRGLFAAVVLVKFHQGVLVGIDVDLVERVLTHRDILLFISCVWSAGCKPASVFQYKEKRRGRGGVSLSKCVIFHRESHIFSGGLINIYLRETAFTKVLVRAMPALKMEQTPRKSTLFRFLSSRIIFLSYSTLHLAQTALNCVSSMSRAFAPCT